MSVSDYGLCSTCSRFDRGEMTENFAFNSTEHEQLRCGRAVSFILI